MKKIDISTTKYPDRFALVDDEDYASLNMHKWYTINGGVTPYVARTVWTYSPKKSHIVYMHRVIMKAKKGLCIDHINSNGMDNQKDNLRICTQSQNCMNTRKHKGKISIFKGVFLQKQSGKWVASICRDKKQIHLGCFTDEVDAAKAYDKKAKELFLSFARPNFKE